jgi:hypothetical protein
VNRHLHPPRRRQPRVKRTYEIVIAQGVKEGRPYNIAMSAEEVGRQQARSKGGSRGKGHKFTSEDARKAALRLWAKRWRLVKGVRVGKPAYRRPAVRRAPLRAFYAKFPTNGVRYDPVENIWVRKVGEGWPRTISERTALRHLGHLPYYVNDRKGLIPEVVIPVVGPIHVPKQPSVVLINQKRGQS